MLLRKHLCCKRLPICVLRTKICGSGSIALVKMQSADPATLFQTDASLTTGLKRALKWKHTSKGAEWGSPAWLSSLDTVNGAATNGDDSHNGPASEEPVASSSTSTKIVTDRLGQLQVDEDVRERAARGVGTDGGRYKVLSMEVLEPAAEGEEAVAFIAEGRGAVRALSLETLQTLGSFRAGTGPCFCVGRTPVRRRVFVATGSWDKTVRIYACPLTAQAPTPSSQAVTLIPNAASDFLKALAYDDASQNLFSGGTDLHVRAWDLRPLLAHLDGLNDEQWLTVGSSPTKGLPTVETIGNMRQHTRPITKLVVLPITPPHQSDASISRSTTLLSADSMGRILESAVTVERGDGTAPRALLRVRRELRGHETSVNDVRVAWTAEDVVEGEQDAVRWTRRVWTASSDKTAKRFDIDGASSSVPKVVPSDRTSKAGAILGDEPPLLAAASIEHEDYVQSVLPLPTGLVPSTKSISSDSLLLTGSSDENITIWDFEIASQQRYDPTRRDLHGNAVKLTSTGDEQRGLIRKQEGHWHEVTALALWRRQSSGPLGGSGNEQDRPAGWWTISASYDGSLRRWPLADLLNPPLSDSPKLADLLAAAMSEPSRVTPAMKPQGAAPASATQMTAEEEAELAELMSDED